MSAAATAAGYLYASGRLRGRQKEGEQPAERTERKKDVRGSHERRPVRVAVMHESSRESGAGERDELQERQEKPRRTPTIQYRTRRWKPDERT